MVVVVGVVAGIPGSPAAFYHFLTDAAGVTIKSVKELGLQETGFRLVGLGVVEKMKLERHTTL